MSKSVFYVNISPQEAQSIVEERINADLVESEAYKLEDGKYMGVSIFEKYYFRSSNRAALTVIFENFYGRTQIKSIATGSSQGLLFNFDWGAADDFADSVAQVLKEYIVE